MYEIFRPELDELYTLLTETDDTAIMYQKILELVDKSYHEGIKQCSRFTNQ